jgi:hypothetical protein
MYYRSPIDRAACPSVLAHRTKTVAHATLEHSSRPAHPTTSDLISTRPKTTIGVLNLEAHGVIPDPYTLGSMTRLELEKTGRYVVLDHNDMKEALKGNGIDISTCLGRTCAIEAGKLMKADLMLIGSVERFSEKIAITLKLVEVGTGNVQASNTSEYVNLQKEIQRMLHISVKKLLGMEVEKKLVDQLAATEKPVEGAISRANLSGPRMGCYITDGLLGERMRASKHDHGGLGMSPVTSMIGWQQEIQYFSSGNFQCLMEMLFTGAGLESGRFIPSFTLLNGFRFGRQGWELALGPTFRVVKMAKGYYRVNEDMSYDPVDDWHLTREWNSENGPNPYPIMENIDDRGTPEFSTAMVFAIGRTFTSGQLNIPVNAYVIPREHGNVYGLSVGFNVLRKTH